MKFTPVIALSVVLLAVGVGAPRLHRMWPTATTMAASDVRDKGIVRTGLDRAKSFTTSSRIKGIQEALRHYILNHGEAPGRLGLITGDTLSRDGWGRPFHYIAPDRDNVGVLRSYGPDGVRSKDDTVVRLKWEELTP